MSRTLTILVAIALVSTLRTGAAWADGARKALVIGNASYGRGGLSNPLRDAAAVGAALGTLGFRVTRKNNLKKSDMRTAVNGFVSTLRRSDVAIVYYAGHGIELKGKNYLLPVDFNARNEDDAVDDGYSLDTLMARLSRRGGGLNVVIVDACRDDPYSRGWSRGGRSRGLAKVESLPTETYIAFSSQPGATASDGGGSANSPFTSALLRHLPEAGVELDVMFRQVRSDVREATGGRQDPWTNHNMTGVFHLVAGSSQQSGRWTPPPGSIYVPEVPEEPTSSPAREIQDTWKDPTTNLKWQVTPTGGKMKESAAKAHCAGLSLDGRTDWRLPTISELRSLIRGCPATQSGGNCNIKEGGCVSWSCRDGSCKGCSSGGGPEGGCYWPDGMQGECIWYWSSSPVSVLANRAWYVYFSNGRVDYGGVSGGKHVRCVR